MGFEQFFAFFVFVVVARLLQPSDIGLFALAMILAELARVFAVSGFSDAVTKSEPSLEEETSRAAFWGNMSMSVVCAVLVSVIAWPLAKALNMERLGPVLMALAWSIPLSAVGAIHMARQLRRFGHKAQAIRSLLSGIIGGGAAVFAAYHGFGVWSLVVQRFVTDAISVATAWHAFRWIPRLPASAKEIWALLPFSLQMSSSKLITAFTSNIQDLAIGGGAGSAAVGMYRLARRTNDMMIKATISPLSTVAVNIFVSLRDEPDKFRSAFTRLLSVSAALTFPAFFGMAAVADPLIPLVFGEQWQDAVPIVQALAPICVPMVISLYVIPLLTAFGRSSKATEMTTIQLVAAIGASALTAPFGVIAVVGGFLFRTYALIPYQLSITRFHTGLNNATLSLIILKPLFCSIVMAAICYTTMIFLPAAMADLLKVAIVAAEGGLIYTAMIFVFDRQVITWAISLVSSRVKIPQLRKLREIQK
ncbi:oligosaccharide flippase family protein [Pseudomonas sp. ODNR1LW]|nr:oligosaccharide flippase family protein [Pseudomonas sp. ODNR1LW]